MEDGDEGQVMECLIEYKMNTETTMNSKCRAAVEHFQIIALQDFRFSAQFKRACKVDISHHCSTSKAKLVKLFFLLKNKKRYILHLPTGLRLSPV